MYSDHPNNKEIISRGLHFIERLAKGACESCPANEGQTESASYAQDMGCLPDRHDICNGVDKGVVWACHDNPTRVCACAKNYAAAIGVDIPEQPDVHEGNMRELYE